MGMKRKRFAQGIVGGVWPDAYFESIPPGWRFRPTKIHLLQYLKAKILNVPLPGNRIPEVDLYAHHPQDLVGMYKLIRETEWYFFSPRNRKYPNGSRPNRAAGRGFWKATGKELEIKVDDKIIGYQNSLDYYEGKNPNDRTDWKMHELRMTNDIAPPIEIGVQGMKLNDWVLCKVYENSRKAKKRDDEEEEEDQEEEEPQYNGGVQIADMMRAPPLQQSCTFTNQVLGMPYSDVGMGYMSSMNGNLQPALVQSSSFGMPPLLQDQEEEEPQYNIGGVQITDMMREPPLQQSHTFTNQVMRMPYPDVGMGYMSSMNGNLQPPLMQSSSFGMPPLLQPPLTQSSSFGMPHLLQPPLMQSPSFGMPPLLQPPLMQSSSFGMPPLLQPPLMQSSSFEMSPLHQAAQNGTLEDIVSEYFRVMEKKDDGVAVQLPDDGGKEADDKDDVAVQLPEDCGTVAEDEDEDVVTVLRPDKGGEEEQAYEQWLRTLEDMLNDPDSIEENL